MNYTKDHRARGGCLYLRKIIRTRILPVGFFLLFLSHSPLAQSKYIHKYQPMADSLSEVYGIPVSVMLGIAIMESASGTSRGYSSRKLRIAEGSIPTRGVASLTRSLKIATCRTARSRAFRSRPFEMAARPLSSGRQTAGQSRYEQKQVRSPGVGRCAGRC